MDRFPTRQVFDRSRGAAVGAPGDGIAQGAPYVAVLQSEPAGGLVDVTIPTLHLSVTYRAFIQPGAGGTKGETATVIFDQDKIPHVIRGSWEPPGIARGTALPASPVDGQEYDYVADATNGVIWRFRYRSASTSTHKWEFVGGPTLNAVVNERTGAIVSSAYADAPAGAKGPELTVPLAGDYDIGFGAQQWESNFNFTIQMAPQVGATAPGEADAISIGSGVAATNPAFFAATSSRTIRKTGVAAATAIVLKFKFTNGSGAAELKNRYISVHPVRVG